MVVGGDRSFGPRGRVLTVEVADLELCSHHLDAPHQPAGQVDQMAAHRAQHAAALLPVAPPAPWLRRIQPLAAQPIQVQVKHSAHVAIFEQPAQLPPLGVKAQLVIDDGQLLGRLLGGGQHRFGFGDAEGGGFLTDYMLASLQGSHRILPVQDGRRADADDVHLLACNRILPRFMDVWDVVAGRSGAGPFRIG